MCEACQELPPGSSPSSEEAPGNSQAPEKPPRPVHMCTAAPLFPPRPVVAHPVPRPESSCQDKLRWSSSSQPGRVLQSQQQKTGSRALWRLFHKPSTHTRGHREFMLQQAAQGCRPPRGLPCRPPAATVRSTRLSYRDSPPRHAPPLNDVPRLQAPGSACF